MATTYLPIKAYCFDPGGVTGFAKLAILPKEGVGRIVVQEKAESKTYEGLWDGIPWASLTNIPGLRTLIICEYLTSQHPSFKQIGIEVMGAIRFLAYLHKIELCLQSPMMMRPARILHPLPEIKSNHIRDAVHHGIAFAYRTFNTRFEVKINEGEDSPWTTRRGETIST